MDINWLVFPISNIWGIEKRKGAGIRKSLKKENSKALNIKSIFSWE
jgi:hypothetical protein